MKTALRLLPPVLLIALCLWAFEAADIGQRLATADPAWIAASVAALLAQTGLMALRWRLVARCLWIEMPLGWALREYLTGQALNATLPGGMVGDAARAVRSRAGEAGLTRAAQAVVIERAAGQAGLALVAVAGLIAVLVVPGGFVLPPAIAAGMAAGLAGLGLLAALAVRGARLGPLIARCLPNRRIATAQLALSAAAAALNVAAFAAAVRATGTALPIGAILTLGPLILLAMLVPLTVGGWGWREGAAAALFPLAGASPAAGVAAGIAFGAAILLATLPLAAIAVCGRPAGGARPMQETRTTKGV